MERMAIRFDVATDRSALELLARDRELQTERFFRDRDHQAVETRNNYAFLCIIMVILLAILLRILYYAFARAPT